MRMNRNAEDERGPGLGMGLLLPLSQGFCLVAGIVMAVLGSLRGSLYVSIWGLGLMIVGLHALQFYRTRMVEFAFQQRLRFLERRLEILEGSGQIRSGSGQ